MASSFEFIIPPGHGASQSIGGLGVLHKLAGQHTGGAFSIVEHTLEPGVLGAPPHAHANEDEYSFVLEGRLGVMIGDRESVAEVGSYVIKPRGMTHTFWNAGRSTVRFVEIISPDGFESYFEELASIVSRTPPGGEPDVAAIMGLGYRYGLTFEMERMPELLERHKLRLG